MIKYSCSLLIIFLILISCNSKQFVDEDDYTGVKTDYNPQKAGAEIVKSIDASPGYFVSYTNNHFYQICYDNIVIFDIMDNSIDIIRTIPFEMTDIFPDVNENDYISGFGIANYGDKIFFSLGEGINLGNVYSLSIDGQTLLNESLPVNTVLDFLVNTFYYNNSNELYVSYRKTYQNALIYKYVFDNIGDTAKQFVPLYDVYDRAGFIKNFITKKYLILFSSYYACLFIYKNYDPNSRYAVFSNHLNIPNGILSVFDDEDENLWLYLRVYSDEFNPTNQYKMLKLKLLDISIDCGEYNPHFTYLE